MSLFLSFWNHFLYIPVFNALMWLYNGPAHENLGNAVILLTIALRVVLLPLSIISESNKSKYKILEQKVAVFQKDYKNDPEALKSKIREVLKKHRVSPWARSLLIGIQALVLVLLYQVFIGGITYTKLNVLYVSVVRPEVINTNFHGFELGLHDWRWAAAVGVILFFQIYIGQRGQKASRNEQLYAIFFPIMSFLALWALPMVKSIFILTTLAFSYIMSLLGKVIFPSKKA